MHTPPPPTPDPQIAELGSICQAAAEAGAHVLRELFDRPREVLLKGRIDLVTDADQAAEERILHLIAERAPGVAVLAEESGAHGEGAARVRFVVDPLDGTTNYAHGIPLFACTVAAELEGRVVAGCTIDPVRGERFRALRGGGAFGGRFASSGPHHSRGGSEAEHRLQISATAALDHALICTGFPYDRERMEEMLDAFGRFTGQGRGIRRLGAAALDLAYVAAGRLDVFYEQSLKPWDLAAGQLLVEEAGGLCTRFDGSPLSLTAGEVLACPPALAPVAQALLAEARAQAAAKVRPRG